MPLKPGDTLVNNAFGFNGSEWRTALVVAIDRGEIRRNFTAIDAHIVTRPAMVTLLVSGPCGEKIIHRDFTWITQQKWEHLDEFP